MQGRVHDARKLNERSGENKNYNNICVECQCRTTNSRSEDNADDKKSPKRNKLRDVGKLNKTPPIPVGACSVVIIFITKIDEALEREPFKSLF